VFIASTRYYTISFYNGDNVVNTVKLTYGSIPYHVLQDTIDYKFNGWYPEIVPVTEDANYYAQWTEKQFLADYTWAELSAIAKSGLASEMFRLGDTKTFSMGGKTMTAKLIGFDNECNYCEGYTDKSNYPGMTFLMTTAYEDAVQMDAERDAESYAKSSLRAYVDTLIDEVEEELQQVIVPVTYDKGHVAEIANQYLWIPHSYGINYTNALSTETSSKVIYQICLQDTVEKINEVRKVKSSDGSKFVTYWTATLLYMKIMQNITSKGWAVNSDGKTMTVNPETGSDLGVDLDTSETAAIVLGFCI
jgi:hypothetical protein